jgi:cation transport ATPase
MMLNELVKEGEALKLNHNEKKLSYGEEHEKWAAKCLACLEANYKGSVITQRASEEYKKLGTDSYSFNYDFYLGTLKGINEYENPKKKSTMKEILISLLLIICYGFLGWGSYYVVLYLKNVNVLIQVISVLLGIFIYLFLGIRFLRLKQVNRGVYGSLEIGLSLFIGFIAISFLVDGVSEEFTKVVQYCLAFYTAIYVLIRGLENLKEYVPLNSNKKVNKFLGISLVKKGRINEWFEKLD